MLKQLCTPLLVIATLLLVTACSKLTEGNLQKVHNGMTTTEVKETLGNPTETQTSNMFGVISGTTFVYHTGKSHVKVAFLNDKVVATEGEFK